MNTKKLTILGGAALVSVVFLSMVGSLWETNKMGYYQVKQAAMTGSVTTRSTPGTYGQWLGDIYTYQISDMLYFSKHDSDGGAATSDTDPVKVRFNDGSLADLSGALKFRLPMNETQQVLLHQDFKGYPNVKQDLIRQVVAQSLLQTATLMKAEEFYSTRRAEFGALAEEQIQRGIYETISKESKTQDVEGNDFIERTTVIKTDEKGGRVHRAESPLQRYGIEVISFVIKDVDFDPTIDALIAKKKEAEQQKIVARANAERAKQDAITATEQGKAAIQTAQATELVEKIKAVTQAQKDFEVAQFQKKQASEEAQSAILKGEAEAKIARQKVSAGLTPEQKAQFAKDTAIGVAAELAKVQFPSMMVIGGQGQGGHGALDPFQAVGLKSFMDIQERMSTTKQ